MFGLGTWEILLILVAALIFIGPDKLPQVAKSIGRGVRQLKDAMSQVEDDVRGGASEIFEAQRTFREAALDVRDELDVREDLKVSGALSEALKAASGNAEDAADQTAAGDTADASDPATTETGLTAKTSADHDPSATSEATSDATARPTTSEEVEYVEVVGSKMRRANAAPTRDWSQVGKAPVDGRVTAVPPQRPAQRPAQPARLAPTPKADEEGSG